MNGSYKGRTGEQLHKVYRSKIAGQPRESSSLAELYPMKKACQIAEIIVENNTHEYK